MSEQSTEGVYQCDGCGETFEVLDAAKFHAITKERHPVDPEELISRV